MRIARCPALFAVLLLCLVGLPCLAASPSTAPVLDHSHRPLTERTPVSLQQVYGGKVLLIVNTASQCGLASQLAGLEALHTRYAAQGFAVLGFPSGDFHGQEFEDETQIREYCRLNYGVGFPMFAPVHVIGADATGLFQDLARATGQVPQWNFHKYLVGRDGRVLGSWGSRIAPDAEDLRRAIENALRAPVPEGE